MKAQYWFTWILSSLIVGVAIGNECDESLLREMLSTWSKSMDYMIENEKYMNLDGVVSMTMLVDQMNVLQTRMDENVIPSDIINTIKDIKNSAEEILRKSKTRLKKVEPKQYEEMGPVLNYGTWELHYPLHSLNRSLMETPLKCENINFNEHESDQCLSQLLNFSDPNAKRCDVTKACFDQMTPSRFKDYALTHQVIYLIFGETHGCFKELLDEKGLQHVKYMEEYFCANVLRDTEELSSLGFPKVFRDLVLEQIGLCSMFGIKDFLRRDWIESTMSWQASNGCYQSKTSPWCYDDKHKLTKKRHKRETVLLSDGCSTHMTSMGVLAMAVQTRLCIETIF